MKVVRTHDKKVYLSEKRKYKPKEYFKFICSISEDFFTKIEKPKILDIGCATGDFLYYMSMKYKNADFTGMDVVPELLEVAKKEVINSNFILGDIQDNTKLPENKFDFVFMLGVHGLFDSCSPWIDNICKLLNKKGRAFIFGTFNDGDIDVISRIKASGKDMPYEIGWNTLSKKTIASYLDNLNMHYSFRDFDIPIDIDKNEKDPMRTFTLKLDSGKRLIVNGAGMIRSLKLLTIGNKEN
tara:strand:- start:1030 stop:1749 length:720 start_codon:yes stop_codon:yes gene_type:complete